MGPFAKSMGDTAQMTSRFSGVAASAMLVWAVMGMTSCGSTSHSLMAKPSPAQLTAMGSYSSLHLWRPIMDLPPRRVGCVVTPLCAERLSGGRLTAYTQVLCNQCPQPSGAGVLVPAVFHLVGSTVTSAAAETENDEAGYDQMKRLFPRSLWSKADQPISSALNARLDQRANTLGGCGHT